jgi:hypothetical protein
MWLAFALLQPTPPRSIAMATDPEGSISAELGKRYQEILGHKGIEVRLVPSVGAVENVARLRDPKSGINVGIIPSGITDHQKSPELVSLGTLFYEPLWFFYRGRIEATRVFGLRIAVGPEGSGTHALPSNFCAHRYCRRDHPAASVHVAGGGREAGTRRNRAADARCPGIATVRQLLSRRTSIWRA